MGSVTPGLRRPPPGFDWGKRGISRTKGRCWPGQSGSGDQAKGRAERGQCQPLSLSPVAGLIDSLIYHSARAIQKKIDLGKTT